MGCAPAGHPWESGVVGLGVSRTYEQNTPDVGRRHRWGTVTSVRRGPQQRRRVQYGAEG
jgi:hypothetical protein